MKYCEMSNEFVTVLQLILTELHVVHKKISILPVLYHNMPYMQKRSTIWHNTIKRHYKE